MTHLVQTLTVAVFQRRAKGKEMELLIITLTFSVVAVVAQLSDVGTSRFGSKAA